MRRLVPLLLGAWLTLPLPLHADGLDVLGALAIRGVWTRGQATWLERGFGRLTEGAGGAAESASTFRGQAHLGFDWNPSLTWLVHAHGVLQGEPGSYEARRGGLTEAFVQFGPELTQETALRFRAGIFFPQTSFENVEPLWQSPYTLTLSALNTWTAEELRLTGLDAAVVRKNGRGDRFELSGSVFGLNDTSGALIAWRGWSLGDRLTTIGETLPLPRLGTFAPGGAFAAQRSGTRPVDELDGRLGWQVRGRWTRPGSAGLRIAYLDSRGDRRLHRGQYSWETSFVTAGAEVHLGSAWTLVAEAAQGDTGMGPERPGGPHVDVRFRTAYGLVSWGREKGRVSVRLDGFRNRDRDGTAEPDQESGRAWTVAAFWRAAKAVRLGVEYLDVRAQRPAAAFSGEDPDTDARRAVVELRFLF